MRLGVFVAAVAVVAIPIAVSGQNVAQVRSSSQREDPNRRVCQVNTKTGSRLGRVTRCGTKQEIANNREDQRRTLERVQSLRVSFEN